MLEEQRSEILIGGRPGVPRESARQREAGIRRLESATGRKIAVESVEYGRRAIESSRELFPVTRKLAYLNHAAFGTMPAPVVEAIGRRLSAVSLRGAGAVQACEEQREQVRGKMARFVGACPEEIAILKNTPEAPTLPVPPDLGQDGRGEPSQATSESRMRSPSRRAISMMALRLSSFHCVSPHGTGSIRLSTRAASRIKASMSDQLTSPSKRGETTRRSMSLQRSAFPVA